MTELTFAVRRRDPELVRPAAPTPRETKRLSDIDGQDIVRELVPSLFFYRGGGGPRCSDGPALVIRRALGEALVPYYPLAGRLREVEGRKLVVDCTGEGVLFVEADADVRLVELAAATGLRPPFPWKDRLLSDVEGSSGILNRPLLLVQVTRLLCGGFVIALRFNHTLCDAVGIAQFISAVAELARGLPTPTVAPTWCRHLLDARSPPTPAFPHHEYDLARRPPRLPTATGGDIVARTFTFSKADIAVLKQGLPPHLRVKVSTLDVLVAAIWRARTAALEIAPDEDVRLAVVANIRGLPELGIPPGYYGNAIIFLMATTTARALRAGSIGDAVELVRKAKAMKTAEYVRSTADFLVRCASRPYVAQGNLFLVSDVRYAGFHHLDFGWGEPVYGGSPDTSFILSLIVNVKNDQGEDALAVPVELPQQAMDRFVSQVEMLLRGPS